jgi:hypothetical protein
MTSANLHRYVDIFKSQGIKGSDLLELNTEKLEVRVLLQIKKIVAESIGTFHGS